MKRHPHFLQKQKDQVVLSQRLFATAFEHHRAGRLNEARCLYKQILSIDSRHADSLHLWGLVEKDQGHMESAIALISKAISINNTKALYHSNLGTAFKALGRLDEAISCYRQAIEIDSEYTAAHSNLGGALADRGDLEEALVHCWRAAELDGNNAQVQNNLGVALEGLGRFSEAANHFQSALLLQPNFADAYNNLGNVFQSLDQIKASITCYKQALTLNPKFAFAFNNLGKALHAQSRLAEAIACYDQALTLQPDYAEAGFGKAVSQLLQGNFADGWQNYEWRWKVPSHRPPMRQYAKPLWQGEPLNDCRLLIWGEQGIGDEVMFAGLFHEVANLSHNCVLDCDERLRPLFRRSFPKIPVQETSPSEAEFSAHIPSGSLGRLLRPNVEAFARTRTPYLVADPERTRELRKRYGTGKRVIGLAWYTNNRKTGLQRCIHLPQLSPLFTKPGNAWISLQYGNTEPIEPVYVDHSIDQLTDLDAFAAQISALDLVITIDNSTAHLAGALGVPVWVLLPFTPNFRWLQSGTGSLWYPGMRLFRQSTPGDWQSVIEEVRQALG